MKVAFIACEYNPFHNGHLYHINKTKESGADAVVCIMSGNFVQRGEIAITEKHIRAKTALLNGADIVIELPLKYAVSDASHFAEGFIRTAAATGLDGFISFGSKDDLETLLKMQKLCFSDEAMQFASDMQKQGYSYAAAKSIYMADNFGKNESKILDDANNILALEYINNAIRLMNNPQFFSVERKGAAHDSDSVSDNTASAGFIRNEIYRFDEDNYSITGLYKCESLMPEITFNTLLEAYSAGLFPADKIKAETALFSRLLTLNEDEFRAVNNVNQGLENRITEKIRISSSLEEAYSMIKTKRFTHARIRQILLQAALGIKRDDINAGPSYIRILGFNNTGRAILRKMKDTAKLPVIMNLSEIDNNDTLGKRDAHLDYIAGKIFNICCPCPREGNTEYNISPVIIN